MRHLLLPPTSAAPTRYVLHLHSAPVRNDVISFGTIKMLLLPSFLFAKSRS
jgi:hypothetical protein